MNKEFFETEKAKWEVLKVKFDALKTRDDYYFAYLKKVGILLAMLSTVSFYLSLFFN